MPNYTRIETSIIELLAKTASEYDSLIRLEGSDRRDDDRRAFFHAIATASDIITNRAIRRESNKGGSTHADRSEL